MRKYGSGGPQAAIIRVANVVGHLGKLDELKKFRKNIYNYAHGCGAGFKAFKKKNADA